MPWRDYAAQLQDKGFGRGTIISFDSPYADISVNLRRFMPETTVWSTKRPYVMASPPTISDGRLVVWNDTHEPRVLDSLRQTAVPRLGIPLAPDVPVGRLEGTLVWSDQPATVIGYALVSPGQGDCP